MPRLTRLAFSTLVFLTPNELWAEVVINEVMSENRTTLEDPHEPGEFEDWLELFNRGAKSVDLGGLYLTDDPARPTRWRIADGLALGPGEHLIIWADDDGTQGPTHTNFNLDRRGETVRLIAADGETVLDEVRYPPLEADESYGRYPDGGDRWLVMPESSPAATNRPGFSPDPQFSGPGGTFAEPVTLEITADAPKSRIFYTLDGAVPDEASGTPYLGSISIRETTWVRARVYEEGLLPGRVASAVYLALAPEIRDFQSNLPLVVIDTFGFNVDAVWNPARPRPFRPVMATFMDTNFATGVAAISDPATFAGYGGLHVRGQSTAAYPKKQYAFETWNENGEDHEVSLLGLPAESDWILQAPYSDKTLMRNFLMYNWSNDIGRYAVRSRFVEVFVNRDATRQVDADDYVGVYVFMERIKRDPNRVPIARLEATDVSEPEISGGYLLKKDWLGGEEFFRTSTYNDGLIYVDPIGSELNQEQKAWIKAHFDEFESALSGPNFADADVGYSQFIDVGSFIDHHILVELARNVDGYVLSTYLYKDRGGKITMGPIWDYNGSLGGADYFCSFDPEGWHYEFSERLCGGGGETFPADNPNAYHWYRRLFEDPDFLVRYADRWFELREGPLSTERLTEDIEEVVLVLTRNGAESNPVQRNFERWDILDRYVWPNFFVGGSYRDQVDWMKTWLVQRVQWMDTAIAEQYASAPLLSHPGGRVERGFEVSIEARVGEIFYALNGADPMREDRTLAPEAVRYTGPISITENTRLRVRTRFGDMQWSRMVEALYATDVPNLMVTELMFNPPRFPDDQHSLRSNYEYMELQNTGDHPIDLTGVRYLQESDRVLFDFTFGAVKTLLPGDYVVVARNVEAFQSRYGDDVSVAGGYTGTLSNNGDRVRLQSADGFPILDFSYQGTWYPSTNGDGFSLVLRDLHVPPAALSRAESWQPSAEVGGSPGREEPLSGGLQRFGDVNQDGRVSVVDAVAILLSLQGLFDLPCKSPASNGVLLDTTGDGSVNTTDAIHILLYLFRRGESPVLGLDCQPIVGCPPGCVR